MQDLHKGNEHRVNDPSTVPDICSRDTQGGTSLVKTGQATWSSDTLCPEDRRGLCGEGLTCRQRDNKAGARKGSILLPTWDTQSVTAPGLSLCGPSDPIFKPSVCPLRQASSPLSRERTALSDAPAWLLGSRHRGECVLACYKYTSESENQRPPARQPVCPAAPQSGVQALPGQPRVAYFPS